MSKSGYKIWRCDHCKKEVHIDDLAGETWPEGWLKIEYRYQSPHFICSVKCLLDAHKEGESSLPYQGYREL